MNISTKLWLTVVATPAVGWLVSVRYGARQYNARESRLLDRIDMLEHEAQEPQHYWDGAGEALDNLGY